jgi:tetratricopeptide (TPR) repeat protein
MKNADDYGKELAALDELIQEIIVDAYGEDEQLWAFRQVIEDEVNFPCDGLVIGEPISVTEIDYDGNERRGLTAKCRRLDGSEHIVAASDVVFPRRSIGARYIACYRKWLGIEPFPPEVAAAISKPLHKETETDLDQSDPVELVVLAVKDKAARCRILGSDLVVTFRTSGLWDVVPGEIAVISPRKRWNYAGHPYLSGEIESVRLDASALGLVPLKLKNWGTWTPEEHYWGEKGGPIDEWAKPIIARGSRQEFEMEQVRPGVDPDDFDSDPIGESNDLKDAGDRKAALKILMELCQADLRCLDAHSHLGNFYFDSFPDKAIRHYEMGLRIGELSLGPDFDGLLHWGLIDNRPLLRCMHGYGLCLWRLDRFGEAERIFNKMLWLNPSDNQGVRFLIEDVKAGTPWEERQEND